MSPRQSLAGAQRTRRKIIDRTVALASTEGFEAVTLGRLAGDLQMSKAGVIGHFGTMEALELEAVARAIERFTDAVWQPAADKPPGRERLAAICDHWVRYLGSDAYVGACLTSAEHSPSSTVRAAVAEAFAGWRALLAREAKAALAAGDLPDETNPGDLAFELGAIALATGQALRLGLDRQAKARARRLMRSALAAR